MFENEKRELFELIMKVQKETNAYVDFEFSTRTGVHICIKDNGYDSRKGYDGNYDMYESPDLIEESTKNYNYAKEHILRLLERAGHPE